jgi:hypothetical protein
MARGGWSVNSDDWLVASAGAGPELLEYHDMLVLSRDMADVVRVTANDSGAYDEACDFWVGNPDSALAKGRVWVSIAENLGTRSGQGARREGAARINTTNGNARLYTLNGKLMSHQGTLRSFTERPSGRGGIQGVYIVRFSDRGGATGGAAVKMYWRK